MNIHLGSTVEAHLAHNPEMYIYKLSNEVCSHIQSIT